MPATTSIDINARCKISDTLLERHYQELKESGISDEIIRLNFQSIEDNKIVDRILGRNAKRRWQSSELAPGWLVSGVDPQTGESRLSDCQYKPDNPRINEKGKKVKYENALDTALSPLFLRQENYDRWQEVRDDILIPLIIGEGAKKAASGISHGFDTISLPGVSTCRKLGRLHQDLLLFCGLGRPIYLCFDNDILYKKPVFKALVKLAVDLAYHGCKVFVIDLPPGSAKGMDDYLAKFGKENFQKLIESALTFEEFKSLAESHLEDGDDREITSKLAINYHLIKQRWGEFLAFNSMTKEIELYGTKLKEEECRLTIALEYDIDMSSTDSLVILNKLARENTYSPVVDYLNEVSRKHQDIDVKFLDDLAFKFFGVPDQIYSTYFKKFLVSAVARARRPGCQMDHVFMLQSFKQGTGKSTFFKTLFGEDFFTNQLGSDIEGRDEKMKIASYWCLEWAECDRIYRKNDMSAVKNFITSPVDTFRAPYARKEESHPRPSLLTGTTNDLAPLRDPSGARRFMVTPVLLNKIPRDLVAELRDQIWAAADKLYHSGYSLALSEEDEILQEISNEKFSEVDPWQETIENLLADLGDPDFIATKAITDALGFDNAKDVKSFDLVRIQTILKKIGFNKSDNPKRIAGKQMRGWERINKKYDFLGENNATPVTEAETHTQPMVQPRYTPVTPPVTAVTVTESLQQNTDNGKGINNLPLHPVTPPVTEGVTDESVDKSMVSDTVTPVTPQTAQNENIESGLVAVSGSSEVVHPAESTFNVGDFVLVAGDGVVEQVARGPQHGRYQLTNNLFYYPPKLEKVSPDDNAELLRVCIADQNWQMVEELAAGWCQEFKKVVYGCLSGDERTAIKMMKQQPESLHPAKAISLPVLEVGKEYFSAINQQQVKVFSIHDDLEICNCTLNGKTLACDFGDLRALPDSSKLSVDIDDRVEILSGKYKGKKASISSQLCEHGPLYLKIEGVRATSSSKFKFWGHQLKHDQ